MTRAPLELHSRALFRATLDALSVFGHNRYASFALGRHLDTHFVFGRLWYVFRLLNVQKSPDNPAVVRMSPENGGSVECRPRSPGTSGMRPRAPCGTGVAPIRCSCVPFVFSGTISQLLPRGIRNANTLMQDFITVPLPSHHILSIIATVCARRSVHTRR